MDEGKAAVPLERWMGGGRTAFGGGGEANGEGVLLMCDTGAHRLEATVSLPRTVTVGSQFINFYVGFNDPGGTPIVEAGVSLSDHRDYSPHPPAADLADRMRMGRSNTFGNPANSQAGPLFWNVFTNSALDRTASNMPASGDLRGQTIPFVLNIADGKIWFRAGVISTVPVPFRHPHVRVGHAKMIAAIADASTSGFSEATMRLDRLDGKPAPPGRAWRVNGTGNSQRLEATAVGPATFTCRTAGAGST